MFYPDALQPFTFRHCLLVDQKRILIQMREIDSQHRCSSTQGGICLSWAEETAVQCQRDIIQTQALSLMHRQRKGILQGVLSAAVCDSIDASATP